jgi:hypothetical protein
MSRQIATLLALPFYTGMLLILGRWVLTFLTGNSPTNGVLKVFHMLTRPFYWVAEKLTRGHAGNFATALLAFGIAFAGLAIVQVGYIVWLVATA